MLTDDSRAIDTRHLGFTMSPHEECGVEEAVRLIEANKGDSVVITLGPPEAVEQLRDAMALGIDRAIHLQTDGQEWDGEATAAALTEAIKAEEAASGPFDLIFFGNESADSGGFQVGARVAHSLGRPLVTGLKRVALEGASVRCEQEVEPPRGGLVGADRLGQRSGRRLPIPLLTVGLEMNGPVDPQSHRVTQLLDGFRRPEREHHRVTAVGLDDPHRLLDAALLVRAHREPEMARVDRARVFGEHDPPSGDRHPFDAGEDPQARIRVFSGSNSGVAPATATETG